MGLIAMSERDLQRIEILSKVVASRMTMVSAAHVLDLSERQVRPPASIRSAQDCLEMPNSAMFIRSASLT